MRVALAGVALIAACLARSGESAPASGPETAPPWDVSRPWHFDLDRAESFETRLDGKEIWFKNRGPGRTRMQVVLEGVPDAPGRWRLRVPNFQRESDARGGKHALRFDPVLFDERYEGRRTRVFRSDGEAPEREALAALAERPWYELDWKGGAWTRAALVAEGEAWPVADGLPLGRELVILLPALPAQAAEKGATFRQAVVLPYPVPLAPPMTALVEYRVEDVVREHDRAFATVVFSSSVLESPEKGVEWGGIALSGVRVQGTLAGQLKVDLEARRLLEARLEARVLLDKTVSGEAFTSEWKVKTLWKDTRK